MCELRETLQWLQVSQLSDLILRQDEGSQVGDLLGQRGLYGGDAVAGQQQRVQARGEREVCDDGDVVIGEVDTFLILDITIKISLMS